jgi:malate synthase
MGGMAAQIPVKSDVEANEKALASVREDKLREVHAGHDGTWVAHPGLVPVAREIFDKHMQGSNQIDRARSDTGVSAQDLLEVPDGDITVAGLRHNVDVGIRYLEAWLRGSGCVPIHHLMEDAATAEICRAQVWQWVKHGAVLDSGDKATPALVKRTIRQELKALKQMLGSDAYDPDGLTLAAKLLEEMMTGQQMPEWLTAVAYRHIES